MKEGICALTVMIPLKRPTSIPTTIARNRASTAFTPAPSSLMKVRLQKASTEPTRQVELPRDHQHPHGEGDDGELRFRGEEDQQVVLGREVLPGGEDAEDARTGRRR